MFACIEGPSPRSHRPIPINFVPTNFFPPPPPFETRRAQNRGCEISTRIHLPVSNPVSAFTIQSTIPSPFISLRAHYSNGRRLKGEVVNFLFNFFACIASWKTYIYIYTHIVASSIDARMKREPNLDTYSRTEGGKDRFKGV